MIDNLNLYRVFYNVAKLKSISKAAERLFISQPAVSKSISNLENSLHTKLMKRSSRGIELNHEGQLLFDQLEISFGAIQKAEEDITRNGELGVGEIRIGVSTSLCRHILLPHLKDYIVEYPHINVSIDCHSTYNIVKELISDNIDVGFICETDLPQGYSFVPLQQIHDTFIASRSYLKNLFLREKASESEPVSNPWLLAGNVTSLVSSPDPYDDMPSEEELEKLRQRLSKKKSDKQSTGENHILIEEKERFNFEMNPMDVLERSNLMLLERNNITRKHLDNYFFENAINPSHILEINDMDLLIDFASIGMGVSAIVKEFAEEPIASGEIVEIPLPLPVPARNVGFVYKDRLSENNPIQELINICTKKK